MKIPYKYVEWRSKEIDIEAIGGKYQETYVSEFPGYSHTFTNLRDPRYIVAQMIDIKEVFFLEDKQQIVILFTLTPFGEETFSYIHYPDYEGYSSVFMRGDFREGLSNQYDSLSRDQWEERCDNLGLGKTWQYVEQYAINWDNPSETKEWQIIEEECTLYHLSVIMDEIIDETNIYA